MFKEGQSFTTDVLKIYDIMFSKAIILLCLQAVAWVADGSKHSNCRLERPPEENVTCGDSMCMCSKTVACCQNNEHYNLSYIPRLPRGIIQLYFQDNYLPSLSKETFQNVSCSSIYVLALINNTIKTISQDAFSSFTNLEKLCLDQNEDVNKMQLAMSLRRISSPHSFKLYLANMNWKKVSDSLFNNNILASKIVKLDLSGNRIESLNWTAFQHLTAMEDLNLSGNKILEMVPDIVHINLISLNLDGNRIGSGVPRFCSTSDGTSLFPNLTTLNINDNVIIDLNTDSFKCLSQLQHLGLRGNSIETLKNNTFSGLHKLKTLNLALMGTRVNFIEPSALNNSNLVRLILKDNKIVINPNRHLHIFQQSTNLRNLDISSNNLKNLDDTAIMDLLRPMTRLEKLLASRSKLRSIPEGILDAFENLTVIYLDRNNIVKFPGLCNSVKRVKRVKRLSLQGNSIRVLDKSSISGELLRSVRELNLADNPFSCTCENLWFRSVINDKGMIGNLSLQSWPSHYHCASPSDLKGTLLKDYLPTESSCNTKNYIYIVAMSFSIVLIVFAVSVVLGYKYRWYVKYWLYKLKSNKHTPEEEPLLTHNYDAFLIYNPSDSQYVHYDFRLLLEDEHSYKLHIWDRDVPAGSDNFMGIVSGMEASRRVIAIISKDSLDDGWFQFQLSVALDRQVELKRQLLILVILENVECDLLSKYWCVLLTRLPTAKWCHDKTDVKRAAFEQQLFNHLGNRNNS